MAQDQVKNNSSTKYLNLGVGVVIGIGLGYIGSKLLGNSRTRSKNQATKYRRIVTGHDENGKSIVVVNDNIPNQLAPSHRNITVYNAWRCIFDEKTNKHGTHIDDPCQRGIKIPLEPPLNGSNFRIIDFRSENENKNNSSKNKEMIEKAWNEFGAQSQKLNSKNETERKHPFMHRTKSIDYAICLSGKMYLVLDESEILIQAGDVIVQRATNHAWKNCFKDTCVMAFILIDTPQEITS